MTSHADPAIPQWQRLTVASCAVVAAGSGFSVAGTGTASAAVHAVHAPAAAAGKPCDLVCQIQNTWNRITGAGHQANPPGNAPAHSAPPAPAHSSPPRQAPAPAPARPGNAAPAQPGSPSNPGPGPGSVPAPGSVSGRAPVVAGPQSSQTVQLPAIAQDPQVFPEQPPTAPSQVHLESAASQDQSDPASPLVVAGAAGLIGGVAALHLSVLSRRLRRPPLR